MKKNAKPCNLTYYGFVRKVLSYDSNGCVRKYNFKKMLCNLLGGLGLEKMLRAKLVAQYESSKIAKQKFHLRDCISDRIESTLLRVQCFIA